jgi:outer membrane protein OmpA-like peptidoglycan-associated protein
MSRVLALTFVASLPSSLAAQVAVSQARGNANAPAPKWDIFVGYSILDPRGTFYPIQPDGSILPVSFKLEKTGMLESATTYFNRNVGLQVEAGEHDLFTNTGFASTGSSNSGILTLTGGLIYRWPGIHFTPFVHGFAGGADVDGPDHEPYTWGPVVGGGGGLDWYFGCHFGVRLFQADYEFLHANSGSSSGSLANDNFVWGDEENINSIRLAAGLVFRGASAWGPAVGCGPLPPPALVCVAAPGLIFPGEPVTVTATASGLNPKKTATYTWSGMPVSGNGNVATVDTASLAPGTYTVRSTVTEGPKAAETADCQASFTVRPWEPPTLICAAGPMTINADQTSTITLTGRSPQNRPLTYSCTSTAGKVDMAGSTGTFSPNGAPEGPVTINCIVADDKGQTANCNTSVTIQPPPVVIHHVQPLCSIDFSNDKQHPTRVDNEAKACLDEIALTLQQHPDETVVVVGEATGNESQSATGFGAQRAVNTKDYLTTEKGIDPSRITVVSGSEGTQGVEDYLVPQGANFTSDVPNTTPVDEGQVKPQERKPPPTRPHAHKQAPAKTPADAKKKPAGAAAPAQGSTGP